MELTGGCLCGAVRYRITAEPIAVRACWCRLCQYLGAGSGTVNAVFPTAAVHLEGVLATHSVVADSGNRMHRGFCPTCGTPVTSAAEERPQMLVLRVGTLDDPNAVRPAVTIWTAVAPGWACIDANIPALAGQPPPPVPAP